MENTRVQLRKEFIQKQEILNNAKTQLKSEFIGLDAVIDDIIASVCPWFLFPDIQEKPVIINLWGLTGVGKSSLVCRLAELLGFSNRHYRFDIGEIANSERLNIHNQLRDLSIKENKRPVIISLDEFQHAKSIDEESKERIRSEDRIIWKLLDNGKFDVDLASYHDAQRISDEISFIEHMISNNVKVKNGIVTRNKMLCIETKHYYHLSTVSEKERKNLINEKNKGELKFIHETLYELFYRAAPHIFKNEFEVRSKLLSFNEMETLSFVRLILESTLQPRKIDCSKSIIFVIGNLDEAYTMSHNYNPDLSADEFHELSKKITIPVIKRALHKRFRNEQIARLGNTHIIYPAFSSDNFKKIILMELAKVKNVVKKKMNIEIQFDESIVEMIFSEGVYPTQGTRPIFTTIHQLINSRFGKIASELIINSSDADLIKFSYINENILIEFYKKAKVIFSIEEKQELKLHNLRKCKKDDMQAITAVHESGHAICSIFLMKTIPEVIYSITADADSSGFIYTKYQWKYISKKEIIKRIAVYLGGYTAEKIIFGHDNLTTGAESDIESATTFISRMLRCSGMGDIPANYGMSELGANSYLKDDKYINKTIKEYFNAAKELSETTILNNENIFLKFADYLSDNSTMSKGLIIDFCKQYCPEFSESDIILNGDNLFYREHLKQKSKNIKKVPALISLNSMEISLNKNSEKV